MGPYITLMALGANVIAIDLDRPQIWERLISIARSSPGNLIFPIKNGKKLDGEETCFCNALF